MSSNSNSNVGMGFLGWLTLLFIGLKLTGYINWSWWWVLSPIWGVTAIVLSAALIAFLIVKIIEVFE